MTIANTDPEVQKRLTSFVERAEHMMAEIDEVKRTQIKPLQEDLKEIISEAKGAGFDAAIIRRAAKRLHLLKTVDQDDFAEAADLWRIYWKSVKDVLGLFDPEDE